MKYLLALLLLPLAAQAETITLGSEACTGAVMCSNVPNSAGEEIAWINYAPRYSEVSMVLNGVRYAGSTPGIPTDTLLVAQDGSGSLLRLTLVFSEKTKCARYCTQQWSLVGGTIVR